MNLGILFFIILLLGVGFYALINKKSKEDIVKKENEKMLNNKRVREEIKEELDGFLKNSHFFTPIAQWRNKTIYEYIFNKNGYLYKFEDIMPENEHVIGRDEDDLCFERLNYKRVKNPTEFFEKNADAKKLVID